MVSVTSLTQITTAAAERRGGWRAGRTTPWTEVPFGMVEEGAVVDGHDRGTGARSGIV